MQMLEIPALTGEFIPAGTKFAAPVVPGGTAKELVAMVFRERGQIEKALIEHHMKWGAILHEAQARLFTEITGKRLSNETRERAGQISKISGEWRALTQEAAEAQNKQLKAAHEWAYRMMQFHRTPEKAEARIEAKATQDAKRVSAGTAYLPSRQVPDSSSKEETRPPAFYDIIDDLRTLGQLIGKAPDSSLPALKKLVRGWIGDVRTLTKE